MSAISYDSLLSRNLALIEQVSKKKATEESRFIDDLELDSVDLVALVSEMEDEFHVLIPEDRLHMFRTVGDATRCLHDLLGQGDEAA